MEHVAAGRGEDAAKAKGILKVLKTEKVCKMLCFVLDVRKTLRDLSVQFQSDQLLATDVGRKIEATLADLEVLKPRLLSQPLNPKLSQAHYQLKFGANYYPVTGILKFGKDLKQEVKLLTNRSTENLDETFSSFIAATTILACLVCCYLGMLLLLS